ncbi:MAG: hypothetical protein DRI86_04840, partial [Bacteroidetes bacterium]
DVFDLEGTNETININNCLIHNNATLGTNYPTNLGILNSKNTNGDSTDTYGNLFLNPLLADTANSNYHLLAGSPCIDAGNNTYVSTTSDYDGNLRVYDGDLNGINTIDIGPYEYIPASQLDAGIYSLSTSNSCEGKQNVNAELRNFGTDTITSVIIGWKLNNISQTSFTWTGSLLPSATINIIIDSLYSPSANTSYNLEAFITQVNNSSNDTISANDSIWLNNQSYLAKPIISIPALNTQCINAADIILSGATPLGGAYSGSYITAGVYSPSTAGIGNHQIIYTYTDSNNCTNSDTITTAVSALPTVSFASLPDACADVQQLNLSGGSPAGGVYSGANVNSAQGIFYPAVGTYPITYTFTDANGCIDSASANQHIRALPTANFSIPPTACINDTVNIVYTGISGANAMFNWNFDNGIISSGNASGPYNVYWDTTGLAQLSLSITDSGCTSSFNNYVNIISTTAIIIAADSTTQCFGDSVRLVANTATHYSYQWYDANGILSGDTLSSYSATQSGSYYCELIPPNTCSAISNIITINIKAQIIPDFSLAATACKDDMVAINFTGTAPANSVYNWDFDGGTIASGSGAGPYNIIWNMDSIRIVGLSISEGSCSSILKQKFISINQTPASATALGNTDICQGNSTTLSANVGSFTYQWIKDGINTSGTSALYSVNQAGSYQVEVTDMNTNCSSISDSVLINVNTTNFNIAFSANPTAFTIPPFNTTFTNSTPNVNNYYWNWNFGDGNTSTFVNPSHQYLYDGFYSVNLIAQNITTGCYDTLTKTNYISCNGGSANPCLLDPTIASNGAHQVCPNDSVKLWSIDHTTGINYQWLRDGILLAGATDSVYYTNTTGLYQLMLSDTACSVFSQPYALTQHTIVTPSILANGNIQPCSNDSMELYVSTSYNTYQWSNGENNASIYVKSSGSFIVTVTDNNGCSESSTPYVVNASLLQVPEICIVGIDTSTNHNRVIWERQNSTMIDSFRIYKESSVAGVYNLIGSQPFATQSIFEDVNSNPAQQAYRYRITAVDTCGMETAPSNFHKTMHLTINVGLGGVWNLIWTSYKGFIFGSYRIYRGTDSLNLQLLTQIQSTMTSYTDLNPPAGNVFYQIEVISPHPCYPDSVYSKANTNYNTSRSNSKNTITALNMGITFVSNNNLNMQVYPNPNKGNFILEVNTDKVKANQKYNIEVYSVMGKLVYQESINAVINLRKKMYFETMSKGVYFIRLRSIDGVVNGRFVVE